MEVAGSKSIKGTSGVTKANGSGQMMSHSKQRNVTLQELAQLIFKILPETPKKTIHLLLYLSQDLQFTIMPYVECNF